MSNTFSANISEWVRKTQLKETVVVKKLAFDGFAGVIQGSPVDTGRFRGSWRVSLNQVDKTVEPDRNNVPSPIKGQGGVVPPEQQESENALDGMSGLKIGDVVYITNNLPYGPELERGHSKQAPAGMLAITFIRLVNGLTAALAAANQQVP